MISELWHRAQPSRKLINTGCRRRRTAPACRPLPTLLQPFRRDFLLPFPSASSFPAAVSPPAPHRCPFSPSGMGRAGMSLGRTSSLWELHPHQAALGSPRAFLRWHPLPWNKSPFKRHQLGLSPSPLLPRQQSCPSLPSLSFLVTFPGNKLQGAIMPCAKENIKAATISVEDGARQAATQKRAVKFIKLPVGWSTHLQCTRSPSELSEISLLFLLLLFSPFYKEPNKKV